jgi:hypothetical protein
LVTITNSWVIAFNAPKTLKRRRPAGARINTRAKHHNIPKNGAKTKWC